ncbi:MAG: RNA-binding protein [Flavobacteriaceae bacterium]|nr:RNA-binding protein [Flavobacteriaceae bacterium]|tara:strand:- start:1012 stop:1305 length:294 start_codon:yes stop_codon:yes gene_type:complete
MKREFEVKKVNSILSNLIENSSLKGGLNNIKIQTIWKKTMGDNINSYTSDITLKKHTLYVNLSSSVLREELSYGKEKIIKLLNEELNAEIIRKIILR